MATKPRPVVPKANLLDVAALVKSLNTAKSSLATDDSIQILTHFCFNDNDIYAYNEVTAIIVKFKTGLVCALDGTTLLGLLSVCPDKEIEIQADADNASLKFSSGKVKLPVLPKSDSDFNYDAECQKLDDGLVEITLSEIIEAIKTCVVTVTDSQKPEFAGVTLHIGKKKSLLYSSDNATASRYTMKKNPSTKDVSVIIPTIACQQLIELHNKSENKDVSLVVGGEEGNQFAIAEFTDAKFFTKLLQADTPGFEKIFDYHTANKTLFDKPAGLENELAKAKVILSKEQTKECLLTFKKGKVALTANSPLGNVDVSISAKGASDGIVSVPPEAITRMLPRVDQMAVNSGHALVLYGEDLVHIISSSEIEGETKAEAV